MKKMYEIPPQQLKKQIADAVAGAADNYRRNYPENTRDFTRKRVLTMEKVVNVLLSMQGGSLQKELYDMGISASASAFVQQRNKIPWTVFEDAFENFNKSCNDDKRYKGYKILAIDGTTVNMARNPKSKSYVQTNSNIKGYNQLHVNPLYDILNKTYSHCIIQPQPEQDEVGALAFMLKWYEFDEKTLIIADRGYEAYNTIAHFLEKPNVDFLIRVKQDRSAMRDIGKLPMTELDTTISCTITTTQTKEDKEKGYILVQTRKNENRKYSDKTNAGRFDFPTPYNMSFRVVRILLETGEYETLITSLPTSFTAAEIKELYHSRWGIETAFREIKYGIGLTNLHGKKDDFVKQEIFSAMLMSNFCNRIVNQIILKKSEKNMYDYAVNMTMAIHICRQYYRTKDSDEDKLLKDISKYTEPIRPGRKDERNLKAKSFIGFVYRVSA